MIKKLLILLIITSLITPACCFARVGTPAFNFEIEDYFRASGTQDAGKKDDGGLSGGAVTAITLGSIGGAALLGLGAWMYKRKTEQCLSAGCLRGVQNPIVPFCIERDFNSEFYARINNNYPYLKKALSLNEIHFCPHSKYILVYDTEINRRKFDSVKFEIPSGTKEIKFTQVSDSFKPGELTVELFLYKNSVSQQPENAELKNIKDNAGEGIIMKFSDFDFSEYKSAAYIVSNYTEKKIYAAVIEFIF